MPIIKNNIIGDFTIVSNSVLRSKELSWKAKGIYSYLVGCATGFSITIETLATFGNCGRESATSGVNELKQAGLISVEQDNNGKFGGNTWVINNVNTVVGKPVDGDMAANNTNTNKKNESNIPPTPKGSDREIENTDTDTDLEAFKAEYPKNNKSTKKAIDLAWVQAKKNGDDPKSILAALREKKKQQPDLQFWGPSVSFLLPHGRGIGQKNADWKSVSIPVKKETEAELKAKAMLINF